MMTIVARIRIQAGSQSRFEEIVARRRQRCLAEEPGMRRYDLFREAADPNVYTVIEEYIDEPAFKAHLAASTDHHEMMACFDGKPEVHLLEDCFTR